MIAIVSDYVRNIAVFLLFMSFIGIITPNSKYKSYINLVLGFMLIFVMLAPISSVIASSSLNFDDIFANLESEISAGGDDVLARQEFYESSQRAIILSTFKRNLIEQVENIVTEHEFHPVSVSIDINDEVENFGDIRSMHIHMSRKNKEEIVSSIIQVERIRIDTGNTTPESTNESSQLRELNYSEEIENLKNYISSFYNLSVSNIHITIRE